MCSPWYTVGTQCGRLQVSTQAGVSARPPMESGLSGYLRHGLILTVSWGCDAGAWPAKQLSSHK